MDAASQHGGRERESYGATKGFAVVLSLIVAVYGFLGWVGAEEWFKALVCLVAQGLAINTAIAARRAFAKEKPAHGILGLALTAGFAMWSEQGLHHAWTADGSEISPALTWFLCAVEPILFWFAESVQLAKAPVSAEELADQTLRELRREPQQNEPRRRAPLRSIAGGLTGSMALAMVPGSQAHAEPAQVGHEPIGPEPMSRTTPKAQMRNFEPMRATARLMLRQGSKPSAVHEATGVPLSTLKRWRTEIATAA